MSIEEKNLDLANDEVEIDLMGMIGALLQKAWLIISLAVIGALAAAFLTMNFVTPMYSADSMIYIYSKSTSITSLADLQIGSQLAVDFQIVGTTREVVESVIKKLNLDMSYEAMVGKISIFSPTGSHMLQISAVDTDPYTAADISNAMADELRERIADVMNTDMPSVVERAVVPTAPVSPSMLKNAVIAAFVIGVISSAIVVVFYMMDDTIKSDEDIKKYLKLNTLAMIPQDRGRKSDAGRKRSAKAKQNKKHA